MQEAKDRLRRVSRRMRRDSKDSHESASSVDSSGRRGSGKQQIGTQRGKDVAVEAIKLVLLGDSGVGKSSLVLRFTSRTFDQESKSTVGVSFVSKEVARADGESPVKFQIWDTAGQEVYHSLSSLYYRGAQVALVVFDLTSETSFGAVKTWIHELKELGPENIVQVIIGNKVDLVLDKPASRKVSQTDAESYAESRGALYFETSAKTGENVDDIFERITESLFSKGGLLPDQGDQFDSPDVPRRVVIGDPESDFDSAASCCK